LFDPFIDPPITSASSGIDSTIATRPTTPAAARPMGNSQRESVFQCKKPRFSRPPARREIFNNPSSNPVAAVHCPVAVDPKPVDTNQPRVDVNQRFVDVNQPRVDVNQRLVDINQRLVDINRSPVDMYESPVDTAHRRVDVTAPRFRGLSDGFQPCNLLDFVGWVSTHRLRPREMVG